MSVVEMHELSIAQSIVDTVLQAVAPQPSARVLAIHLKIGQLTDISPDALTFGFSVITKGTRLAATSLLIESVAIEGRCRSCGHVFAVREFRFECPKCGARLIAMIRGDELEIDSIDIEEAAPNPLERQRCYE